MFGFIGDAIGAVASGVKNVAGGAVGAVKKVGSIGVGGLKLVGRGAGAIANTSIGRSLIKVGAVAGATIVGGPVAGLAVNRGLEYGGMIKDKIDQAKSVRNEIMPVVNALKPSKLSSVQKFKGKRPTAVLTKKGEAPKGNLTQAQLDAGARGGVSTTKASEAPSGSMQVGASGVNATQGISGGAVAAAAVAGYLLLKK